MISQRLWILGLVAIQLNAFCPLWAYSETTVPSASASTPVQGQISKTTAPSIASSPSLPIQPVFPVVPPSQIPVHIEAEQILHADQLDEDIQHKIRAKFVPVKLTIDNQSGKMLEIPTGTLFLVTKQGRVQSVPNRQAIYESVKRNGVIRALCWGIPIGLISFGILAPFAIIASGTHTRVTNTNTQDNLDAILLQGQHIAPQGNLVRYILIPKSQAKHIQQIVLGRLVNVEDSIETQVVVPLINLESAHAPH